MTQARLADKLGVTANTVARWERGEQPIGNPERVSGILNRLSLAQSDGDAWRVLPRTGVPAELTSFVGRARQVSDVARLLESARLVNLTGTGGVGKTRLALRVADTLSKNFGDGVLFVPLASIVDPLLVASEIAKALDITAAPTEDPLEAIAKCLQQRDVLLLLDNFEQVLSAAPLVVAALLSRCRDLKVLVTSRTVLHVSGEHVYRVPPLEVAESGVSDLDRLGRSEAIQLFTQRARAAEADFALTADNAEAIAHLCRRLDGLPLAIELVAAQVGVLPPRALPAGFDDLLDVLSGGPRDAPERHQTMRAAIAWSFDLLNAEEQFAFRRLGVFVGSFTSAGASAVWLRDNQSSGPATLRMLRSLVEHALIQPDQATNGEARFSLLETIREYALERLQQAGDAPLAQRLHAGYYAQLAANIGTDEATMGAAGQRSLDEIEQDHDNFRAALVWAIHNDEFALAARIADCLWHLWYQRGYVAEGRARLAEVLAMPSAQEVRPTSRFSATVQGRLPTRASLLHSAASLAYRHGDAVASKTLNEEALEIAQEADEPRIRMRVLNSLGLGRLYDGDSDSALRLMKQAAGLARTTDQGLWEAMYLNNLAWAAWHTCDAARARSVASASHTRAQEVHSPYLQALALRVLGLAAYDQGDLVHARSWLLEALQILRDLGGFWVRGYLHYGLGLVDAAQAHRAEAMAHFREAIDVHHRIGERRGLAASLEAVATIAQSSQPALGVRLAGAAAALRTGLGVSATPREQAALDGWLPALRASHASGQAEWETGWALPTDAAYELALETTRLLEAESAPARNVHHLTPREKEVLALLARGHTNVEIADALVLSVRTVERHLSNIYTRLALQSRVDAAAFAIKTGL